MGPYLSCPNTEKKKEEGGTFRQGKCIVTNSTSSLTCYGICGMQGWRPAMEDAHLASRKGGGKDIDIYAVFDGHGGCMVSRWAAENFESVFYDVLAKTKQDIALSSGKDISPRQAIICMTLQQTYLSIDDMLRDFSADELPRSTPKINLKMFANQLEMLGLPGAKELMKNFQVTGEDGNVLLNDDEEPGHGSTNQNVDQHQDHDSAGDSNSHADDWDINDNHDELVMEVNSENDSAQNNEVFGRPSHCGSTAAVFLVDYLENMMYAANAGDSRVVISRNGKAIPMTRDHKPDNESESDRIIAAGGTITNGRVDGNLNLSRSLGDLFYKQNTQLDPKDQKITANPDIQFMAVTAYDEFAVLACDGIWEYRSNQYIVNFVRSMLPTHSLSQIAAAICDDCLSASPSRTEGLGCDNMTVIIVVFAKELTEKAPPNSKRFLYGAERSVELEHIVHDEPHEKCSSLDNNKYFTHDEEIF